MLDAAAKLIAAGLGKRVRYGAPKATCGDVGHVEARIRNKAIAQ
jgi:hypothetical protein